MYINKEIYTYIPNPDPETPSPEPRIPIDTGPIPGKSRAESEQLFGLLPGRQKKF